ncbi:MAG: hypothetical protein GWN07_03065, partial [Actinobacteria bacterium]|nr:endonuclease/exonuclease/phosphatase family protein [Actinomycetota bacterium]NIS29089.1 endonuclease/exonuclease/phosphatase family protein [Actinomycetota bacterium]NIT94335.1 endonuclease/exonuclease/phosphatase family protein [Actinomycetota bacterium]NIU64495.1 endonuclease/exonuclease/phosphatase family protein [Actinomycetota bacterium]NIV85749.1 hypothetical protein [Actinomycetota bacterium]
EDVIAYLRDVDGDVVFLQEASRPWEEVLAAAGLGYDIVVTRSPDLIFGTVVLAPPGSVVEGFGFA